MIDKYNLAFYLSLFSYSPKYCYNKPIKRNQMEPSEKYQNVQDGVNANFKMHTVQMAISACKKKEKVLIT
jgi:hypothetical protein